MDLEAIIIPFQFGDIKSNKINDMTLRFPIIFIFFCLASCSYLRQSSETIKNFTLCFDDKYTGIDSLINCSGYYYSKPSASLLQKNTNIQPRDTIAETYIFYKNGFFIKGFSKLFCYQTSENLKKYKDLNGGKWGLYTLSGDTIKAQFVESPSTMSFEKGEWWFKIIDRNTIQLLDFKYRIRLTSEEVKKSQLSKQIDDLPLCKFARIDAMPNPDKSWVKMEKWFWCNKEKYKEWKKNRKH